RLSPITILLVSHPLAPPLIYTLSLHDALPIYDVLRGYGADPLDRVQLLDRRRPDADRTVHSSGARNRRALGDPSRVLDPARYDRSEEHTSELQSPDHLVCRLLLEKKKKKRQERAYNDIKKNKVDIFGEGYDGVS